MGAALPQVITRRFTHVTASAELEMTVNMLIQIDKLVQLLESPVFTCEYLLPLSPGDFLVWEINFARSSSSTSRAGTIPILV